MNREYLKKDAEKIAEIDMHDPLYHMYAGIKEYWYLDGYVYISRKPTNATVYMGKSETFPAGTFEDIINQERNRTSNLLFPDTELLDQLEAFAKKLDESKEF